MPLHSLWLRIQSGIRVTVLVAFVCGAPHPAAADGEQTFRVRANNDPMIASLIREGYERSVTFRRLVQIIDRTDGLVYLERGTCRHGVRACLTLNVIVSGPYRMLRIVIDPNRDHRQLLAAIGHELQHAVEALSDVHVTDYHSMYAMFDRIGSTGSERFETKAAIGAGLSVGAEVGSSEGHAK